MRSLEPVWTANNQSVSRAVQTNMSTNQLASASSLPASSQANTSGRKIREISKVQAPLVGRRVSEVDRGPGNGHGLAGGGGGESQYYYYSY